MCCAIIDIAQRRHDKSIKAFLLEMHDVGEDDDFARARDVGRKVGL